MNFWVFRGLGKLVFLIFGSSEVSESLFFSFLSLLRSRKAYFSHFGVFRGLGKLIFLIFEPSEVSESLFFSFLSLPRSQKACFFHFWVFRGLGSLLFLLYRRERGIVAIRFRGELIHQLTPKRGAVTERGVRTATIASCFALGQKGFAPEVRRGGVVCR